MAHLARSAVRFAWHAIAFVAVVSLTLTALYGFTVILLAGFSAHYAIPHFLEVVERVVAGSCWPALVYAFLMELWYWCMKQRNFFALVAFSSLAAMIAGIVAACTTLYVRDRLSALLLIFSISGVALGAFLGALDYLAFRLRRVDPSPPPIKSPQRR